MKMVTMMMIATISLTLSLCAGFVAQTSPGTQQPPDTKSPELQMGRGA